MVLIKLPDRNLDNRLVNQTSILDKLLHDKFSETKEFPAQKAAKFEREIVHKDKLYAASDFEIQLNSDASTCDKCGHLLKKKFYLLIY